MIKILKQKKSVYFIIILLITLSLSFLISGVNESEYIKIKKEYRKTVNTNNIIGNKVTKQQLEKIKEKINKIAGHEHEKEKMKGEIKESIDYINLKHTITKNIENNVMRSTVTKEDIKAFELESKNLPSELQNHINEYINLMNNQRKRIDEIEAKIASLYQDKDQFKDNITLSEIEKYKNELNELPQIDIINKNMETIIIATELLEKKEKEELLKREEEERRRQEEIKNAWVILNVPYISQNDNNILNGCEAAALLMALNYKGYLQGTSLYDYSVNMPKSPNNNAYEGFTHDIFGLEPLTIPHWIAPAPLAAYGRNSSGNQNVIDGTGLSLDELDLELESGNPVVIYVTSFFNPPKEWIEGAPVNLHVQLLTGYNRITGEHLIIDPWHHANGRTSWTMSKEITEARYNAVGKKCVIIK